jgi:hypothetical protein
MTRRTSQPTRRRFSPPEAALQVAPTMNDGSSSSLEESTSNRNRQLNRRGKEIASAVSFLFVQRKAVSVKQYSGLPKIRDGADIPMIYKGLFQARKANDLLLRSTPTKCDDGHIQTFLERRSF